MGQAVRLFPPILQSLDREEKIMLLIATPDSVIAATLMAYLAIEMDDAGHPGLAIIGMALAFLLAFWKAYVWCEIAEAWGGDE